jgi:biotin carboxyl carrier protein
MKFQVEIQADDTRVECEVEAGIQLASPAEARAGKVDLTVDGERRSADWAEVAAGLYSILLNGESYEVRVWHDDRDRQIGNGQFIVAMNGVEIGVCVRDRRSHRQRSAAGAGDGPLEIRAPMPGRVVKVLASEGAHVESGDGLIVIEAMKMQNEIRAPRPGRLERILVKEGAGVETGARLAVLV